MNNQMMNYVSLFDTEIIVVLSNKMFKKKKLNRFDCKTFFSNKNLEIDMSKCKTNIIFILHGIILIIGEYTFIQMINLCLIYSLC